MINTPRLFSDPATGAVNGLQNAPQTPLHPCASATPPCGPGTGPTGGATWSPTPITDACHDITVYPKYEIAAGACEGNGLLIDISDPANPKRIDAVADPNYAYWHGATFSNDGKTVVFTDEWGGGTQPRCRDERPARLGRQLDLRHRRRQAAVPQLLQDPARPDRPGELRQPHPVADPGSRPRHLRPGLVPGRRLGGRLHRLLQAGGDRLLRPRPDQRDRRSCWAACGRPTGTTARPTARSSPAASTSTA